MKSRKFKCFQIVFALLILLIPFNIVNAISEWEKEAAEQARKYQEQLNSKKKDTRPYSSPNYPKKVTKNTKITIYDPNTKKNVGTLTHDQINKNASACEAEGKHYMFFNGTQPEIYFNGAFYDAYCIDRGEQRGFGCYQCDDIGRDTISKAFELLFSKVNGIYEHDRTMFQILGISTGETQASSYASKQGELLFTKIYLANRGNFEYMSANEMQAYKDAQNSLLEASKATVETGLLNQEVDPDEEPVLDGSVPVVMDKYQEIAYLSNSVAADATSLTITVSSIVNEKVTFEVTAPADAKIGKLKVQAESGKVLVGESSWNGSSGKIVVDESQTCKADGSGCKEERNCEAGILVAFSNSNVVKCHNVGQQFVAKIDEIDEEGTETSANSSGIEVGEISNQDKDKSTKGASAVGSDFKTMASSYYTTYCENNDECSGEVPPPGGIFENCCAEGGEIKAHQPLLDELFCDDETLGVQKFKRLKGSDEYIKYDAKFTDDSTAEDIASTYCTVYCTQRIYGKIPDGSTGQNGLYFELTKGDWGTASPYLQGAKRCRVRIDYDKWWKDYDEYLEIEIKSYNDFMKNQAAYRYIDDNTDGTLNKPIEVNSEKSYVLCTTHTQSCSASKTSYFNGIAVSESCTNEKVPTKTTWYPLEETDFGKYKFADLTGKQPDFNYWLIRWDAKLKDDLYESVEVENDTGYVEKIVPRDDYTYNSIGPQWVEEKIKTEDDITAENNGQTAPYTNNTEAGCNCVPSDPVWNCSNPHHKIEDYRSTDVRDSDEPWEVVKDEFKSLAEAASADFTYSTTKARDLERGLDACNAYFYEETENYMNLGISGVNGNDAKRNYKLNTTYSFDYDQIFLDNFGNIQEFDTNVPFKASPEDDNNDGNACWYVDTKAITTKGKSPMEAEDGTGVDIYESRYSMKKYSKSFNGEETFDDFYYDVVGAFQVTGDDSVWYSKNQKNNFYAKFLHKKKGEMKKNGGIFTNDKRFNIDGMYKMKCRWDETDSELHTFVPSGSSSSMTSSSNMTYHNRMYQIYLTTLEGTYDTHHHIGCIGEYCVFDQMVAGGPACAKGRSSTESDGESAMTCTLKVEYSIVLTGICNPNEITAQVEDCKLFGSDYNLFEFKIADPSNILPNVSSGNYTYADNWFTSQGKEVKTKIENDGKKDATYSPERLTYAFNITPDTMLAIKTYNAIQSVDGGYSDFSLVCECAGGGSACVNCKSHFLTDLSNGTLSGMKGSAWANNKYRLDSIRSSSNVHWKGNK